VTDSAFPAYRLANAKQWQGGLSTVLAGQLALDPQGGEGAGDGPAPLLIGPGSTAYWTESGALVGDGVAGPQLGEIQRLILAGDVLWALAGDCLVQLDGESLQQLLTLPADDIVDIAAADAGGLWLLRAEGISPIDGCGRPCGTALPGVAGAHAIASAGGVVAVLLPEAAELHLVHAVRASNTTAPEPTISVPPTIVIKLARLTEPPPTLPLTRLSGDGDRFLIAGKPGFLLLDSDGTLLLRGGWKEGVTPGALVLDGGDLVATFDLAGRPYRRRFRDAAVGCDRVKLTPALQTETPAGDWLRAEVLAQLPEDATLGLRWAAVADEGLYAVVEALGADRSKPIGERLRRIQELLDPYWSKTFVYAGERHDGHTPLEGFGFPLHEAKGPLLWVELTLRRNEAAAAPTFAALTVMPAGESLMDHLPAIYRGNGDRDGTLRRLVGVLEATTLGIDAKIAGLADRLDPARAEDRWLGSLAAMLGLPFDAALAPAMQRDLVKAARTILLRRGTVAGVRALAQALFPRRPITVFDRTEQLAPMTLGGGAAAGSRLPALLAGPTSRLPRLNARLVLNLTRLCPASPCDAGLVAPAPEVVVTIPATPGERQCYDAAVRQMIASVIPAGVRLRLRWTGWRQRDAALQGAVLPDDVLAIVAGPEPLRVGHGPALGMGHVAGRRRPRLSRDGTTAAETRML
jgi:phage tail-like protein